MRTESRLHTLEDLFRQKGETLNYVCGRADPDLDDYRIACRIMRYKKSCHPDAKRIMLFGTGVYRDLDRLKRIKDIVEHCIDYPVFICWDGDGNGCQDDSDTPVEPKYGEYQCTTCGKIVPEREVAHESTINKRTGYTRCTCHNCWYLAMLEGPN